MHDFAEMRAYYPSDLFNIALDKIPCGGYIIKIPYRGI